MIGLSKTTFIELAAYVDELDIGGKLFFTSDDKEGVDIYGKEPDNWYVVLKTRIMYESDYVIVVGCIDGNTTIAKDINLIVDGDINDEDDRIDGLKDFFEYYYENYMYKNNNGEIYFITGVL